MTDRIRAALQRLAKLEGHILVDCTTDWAEAMIEARAALAEPVGEGPSLGEVEDLCEEHCFNVEGYESIECLQGLINEAIFRWGHQPAPPADEGEPLGDLIDKWCHEGMQVKPHGTPFPLAHYVASKAYQYGLSKSYQPAEDVAELVAWLRETGDSIQPNHLAVHKRYKQAAYLLSIAYATGPEVWEPVAQLPCQRHPTPVPVSERLPGPGDCDAKGRCWCLDPAVDPGIMDGVPSWEFCHWEMEHTHWLPATALPLPSGEVRP